MWVWGQLSPGRGFWNVDSKILFIRKNLSFKISWIHFQYFVFMPEWSVCWILVMPNQSALLGGQAYWTEISALLWHWWSACLHLSTELGRRPKLNSCCPTWRQLASWWCLGWVLLLECRWGFQRIEVKLCWWLLLGILHWLLFFAVSIEELLQLGLRSGMLCSMLDICHLIGKRRYMLSILPFLLLFWNALDAPGRKRFWDKCQYSCSRIWKIWWRHLCQLQWISFCCTCIPQNNHIKHNKLLLPENLRNVEVDRQKLMSHMCWCTQTQYGPCWKQLGKRTAACQLSPSCAVMKFKEVHKRLLLSTGTAKCWEFISGRSKLGSWIFHTSTWWLMLRLTVKKKQLSAYVTLTRWTVVLFARFNMSLDPKSLPHLSLIWSRKSRFWPPHAKLNVWLPTGF